LPALERERAISLLRLNPARSDQPEERTGTATPSGWGSGTLRSFKLWRGSGVALAASDAGHGRPVLLLHGQPGSSRDWAAVAADLATDHRVIVPDRLGYGKTSGKAGGFAANAQASARLLRELRAQGVVVVGHSWGGGVALELALDFPELVAGMVLVASVAPGAPLARLDRLLAQPLAGTALAALSLGLVGRLMSWRPSRSLANWRLPGQGDRLAELTRSWRQPETWRSFAMEQRALVTELPHMQPRLGSVTVPTVVLAGASDHVVTTDAGYRLAGGIGGARLEVLPGGHLLPQLQPQMVAAAIRALAASL